MHTTLTSNCLLYFLNVFFTLETIEWNFEIFSSVKVSHLVSRNEASYLQRNCKKISLTQNKYFECNKSLKVTLDFLREKTQQYTQ